MKISTIVKHASSQRFEVVKSFYMHTRGRKSSQSKEADSKTPSCEARRFFQDEDKEDVTSIASQGNLGAVQIVPPTCSKMAKA
jgi:hypothetical protein